MLPDFQVIVGGSDRTSVLRSRLIELAVTDATDPRADEVELTFDDAGSAIALPPHGATIQLSIGWAGRPLVSRGSFVVDETQLKGPPDKVVVRGKSSDMRADLKTHKSRAFRDTTMGAIVAMLAAEHGLTPQVHPSLAGIAVSHRDQTSESNLHFLSRLGRHHDAVAAAKNGRLLFLPKGLAMSASGKSLPPLLLTRAQLVDWDRKDTDREKFGTVRGRHRDMAAGADVYAADGTDAPTRTLRHSHPSAELAQAHAGAERRRGKRNATETALTFQGDPSVFAGRPVTVFDVRDGINGDWVAAKCEQTQDFASGGYTTKLTCTTNGYLADSGDAVSGYGGDDADTATPEEGAE